MMLNYFIYGLLLCAMVFKQIYEDQYMKSIYIHLKLSLPRNTYPLHSIYAWMKIQREESSRPPPPTKGRRWGTHTLAVASFRNRQACLHLRGD